MSKSPDPWLTTAELAEMLALSRAHLARLRMTGDGPPYTKLSRGRSGQIRYRRSDVERWMSERAVASTSARPSPIAVLHKYRVTNG